MSNETGFEKHPKKAVATAAGETASRDAVIEDYLVDLPPIPAVALKVLNLVDDPMSNGAELCRTIATDQGIAFKVLQMANSAYYGCQRRIVTLNQAVAVLGQRTIRSLVLLYSIPASLKRGGRTAAEEKALWEHAFGVAIAGRLAARAVPGVDPEVVFLAGLLHDVGKSIMLIKAPTRMAEVLYASWPPGGTAGKRMETSEFGFDHEQLGSRILAEWGFPEVFIEAARWHHRLEAVTDSHAAVIRLVAIANRIGHHLGLGGSADPEAFAEAVRLGAPLGRDEALLQEVAVGTVNQITAERSLYEI